MTNQKSNTSVSRSLCRSYKRNLTKQFGKEHGNAVYKLFIKIYEKLFIERRVYINIALNGHLLRNILPGIALYDALTLDNLSEKEVLDSIAIFYKTMYRKTAVAYRLLGKIPFFFHLLRKMAARSMSVTYPKEGWTTVWIENSNEQIAFDVSKCFFQDVLKTYEREELLKCFCQIDDDVYARISPQVEWKRTTTLGRCGSKCDFRFIKM